jgi:hypothetical protein
MYENPNFELKPAVQSLFFTAMDFNCPPKLGTARCSHLELSIRIIIICKEVMRINHLISASILKVLSKP